MFDDTALMRLTIDEIAERLGWSYELAMERFYNSELCGKLSDRRTGHGSAFLISGVHLLKHIGDKPVYQSTFIFQ